MKLKLSGVYKIDDNPIYGLLQVHVLNQDRLQTNNQYCHETGGLDNPYTRRKAFWVGSNPDPNNRVTRLALPEEYITALEFKDKYK